MSMKGENTVLTQHKWSSTKSRKQSNYDSNFEIRQNLRRTFNNLKTRQSLVDQNTPEITRITFDKEHNIMYRKKQLPLYKKYSDTIEKTPSLCRSLKLAHYENISVRSKVNKNVNTSLDHADIKNNLITSKDYINDKIPITKYKAIFYKDLCISGKNISMWKRIKYRLRPLSSSKIRSDSYIVSTGLSRTLSTCNDKKSNDLRNHLKFKNNLESTNDTPYSRNYVTMHLNVETSKTQQELTKNNNKVDSKLKCTPCMLYDDESFELPVVNFPENSVHDYKKSIKAIVKTKISKIMKQILTKLLDEYNTQCDEINTTSSCKTISEEKRNICERKSKCVVADIDCKDKCISNRNDSEATCKLSIYEHQNITKSLQTSKKELCNVNTITINQNINKNNQSQVPKCKQISKNIQGIFLKCKCATTMRKAKCSNVNTFTSHDKTSKICGNVRRRHAHCKCVKTQYFAPSKDYMSQFNKKQFKKSCGCQYTKPNHKKSKTKRCNPTKQKTNECLACCNKQIGKNLLCNEKGKPGCKRLRTQISCHPKYDINKLNNQNNTHHSCQCQHAYPNPKLSKQTNFLQIFKVKSKEKLAGCCNHTEKILSCAEDYKIRNQFPVLSKHDKNQLTRRKSCSSCDCPCASKQKKKNCKHNGINAKLCMKNTYTPSKNIRSDIDIRCKGSKNLPDSRTCRSAKNDFNSCSTQRSFILKRHAICKFQAQVGDCTNNWRCRSRSCSSNCQMSPRQRCQSTYCSDHFLTERSQWGCEKCSSKYQLLHDRTCCTIPQNPDCKSCHTALTSNTNCQTKVLDSRITPRICTCTKNLNKALYHKPKTICAINECQKKKQVNQNLPCHPNRHRSKHYYSLDGFFRNLSKFYKLKLTGRNNIFQRDDRGKLYEYAFRDGPPFNYMYPVVSPNSCKRPSIWQQCSQLLGVVCMFCFWCPLFFIFRMCRWFDY